MRGGRQVQERDEKLDVEVWEEPTPADALIGLGAQAMDLDVSSLPEPDLADAQAPVDLVANPVQESGPAPITIVLNWAAEHQKQP